MRFRVSFLVVWQRQGFLPLAVDVLAILERHAAAPTARVPIKVQSKLLGRLQSGVADNTGGLKDMGGPRPGHTDIRTIYKECEILQRLCTGGTTRIHVLKRFFALIYRLSKARCPVAAR